jgi:hypothetical protein
MMSGWIPAMRAAAHAAVVWDVAMAEYGRYLLGQDRN